MIIDAELERVYGLDGLRPAWPVGRVRRRPAVVGIGGDDRAASGITEGDVVEVGLRLDTEPRFIELSRLTSPTRSIAPLSRAAFDQLSYGLKRWRVRAIKDARARDAAAAHRRADHHESSSSHAT